LINDLFEDPDAFMAALVEQGYIVPGHPEQSTFFKVTSFDGPMYRVFTDEELQAFEIWSMWLGSNASQQPVETDVSRLMAARIDHFRDQQQGTPTHHVTKLTGSDPGHTGQVLEQSVGAWFEDLRPCRARPGRRARPILSQPLRRSLAGQQADPCQKMRGEGRLCDRRSSLASAR
jgi:hypothetical protein